MQAAPWIHGSFHYYTGNMEEAGTSNTKAIGGGIKLNLEG